MFTSCHNKHHTNTHFLEKHHTEIQQIKLQQIIENHQKNISIAPNPGESMEHQGAKIPHTLWSYHQDALWLLEVAKAAPMAKTS